MASASSTMAERNKKRKIAEARQAGTLAPEVDDEGRMVNPHNPEYITKRPWYLGEGGGIKHHQKQKVTHFLSLNEAEELVQDARRQAKQNKRQRALGFRKGACRNCGSLSHTEKDCLERPRAAKSAAWKTGLDIANDDVQVDLETHGKLAYDAKRDSYRGFDVEHHQKLLRMKYDRLEAERRRVRQEERETKRRERQERKEAKRLARELKQKEEGPENGKAAEDDDTDSDSESDSDSDDDGEKSDGEEDYLAKDDQQKDFQGRVARQGGLGGAQMATTVRNLRLREDKAKYLLNLDPNSAYYDPKSRSMRENPLPHLDPAQAVYAGDNFIRYQGDAVELAKTQVFAWNAEARGNEIHLQAAPSQAEMARKHHEGQKKKLDEDRKKAIADKYGVAGGATMHSLDPRLALGQTEQMLKYTADGRVVKGPQVGPVSSKYEEDVFPGNHSSVWGSWYDTKLQKWGYRCCHSTNRQSYCTGKAGRAAVAASEAARLGAAAS